LKSAVEVPFTAAMTLRTSTVLGQLGPRVLACALVLVASTGCSSGTTRQGFTDANGNPTGTGDATPPGDGTPLPAAQPSKPGCAQSEYTEALPTKASLSDLSYSPGQAQTYVLSALQRRYPLGKFITEGGVKSPLAASQGNCINRFLHDTSTPANVQRGLATVVHECGHMFDLGAAKGASDASYVLRDDLKFDCTGGDTTKRGGKTFARSLIKSDAHYTKRESCGSQVSQGCDFYADTYLDGNADDAKFDSGDQGYNSVLEEATQYVNSLATALAFQDAYAGQKASERDGILTFLWYVERYLQMARTKYPSAYAALSEDACWRQATLSVWDRAWFYLDATSGIVNLGLDDAALEPLVKDPSLTAEIDALRKLECTQ
jgi:hypothetical protein